VSIVDSTKPGMIAEGVGAALAEGESPQVTALVERAKGGEADAFDDLMRLYERRVISVGVQMGLSADAALDACQDTFVKVFRYIHRFRSGESFYRWLYRIAVNTVYDHLRQARPKWAVSMEDVGGAAAQAVRAPGVPVEQRVQSEDLLRKALSALDRLSRQERIVFVLRDLQQVPTEDIGRILGLSTITVRRHCMLARRKLRDSVDVKKC
jgi:RNA polymerase sigma-70 factor (ECF subfamily)